MALPPPSLTSNSSSQASQQTGAFGTGNKYISAPSEWTKYAIGAGLILAVYLLLKKGR